MAKQYAAFDEVNIGASLALTFGDQTLQTSANVNAHRIARSTFPLAGFPGQVEAIVYSPDATAPSLVSVAGVPPCALGIVLSTDSLALFVGESTLAAFAAPVLSTPGTATTGGTLAAATYYYKATYTNANGETVGSNEISQTTTGTTSTVTFTIGVAPSGATGTKIYRNTTTGTEVLLDTLSTTPTSYTDNGSKTPGSATVPTANTTGISGYGYCPGDGKVYHNNAVLATIGTATYGDYIGMLLDPVNGVLQFMKNGQTLGASISIATGQSWYYAATTSGNPGDIAVYVNAGTTPIRYVSGTSEGWWKSSATIQPTLLATEPYISLSTDSLANTKFSGDIDRKSQPLKIKRSVQFWPWGQSMPSELSKSINAIGAQTTQIAMRILDPAHKYDNLLTSDVRDAQMPIYRLKQGSSFDAAELSFTGIVDTVHADTDQTKIVYLTDTISQLQVAMYRALYPPNVDPSMAGKPRDISLGPCRNYVPSLYDTTNFFYGAHDTNLSALGVLRVAGKPIAQGSTAGNYQMLPDASGFQIVGGTGLKFTAESTSTGAAYNPLGTDTLAGIGNFLTATPDANGQPTGWICNPVSTTDWQVDATLGVKTPSLGSYSSSIGETSHTLASGFSYVIAVDVSQIPPPTFTSNGVLYYNPATITVGIWLGSQLTYLALTGPMQNLTHTGTYTFTITNTTGLAANFGIGVQFNSNTGNYFAMTRVRVQQLPAVADNVALTPLTLTQILNGIIVQRGPLNGAQVSTTETDAIDAATGYGYGIRIKPSEQPQVQQVVKQIMDCPCGDIYQGRDGKIHGVRLIGPETALTTPPVMGATSTATTGGTLAAATYYATLTAFNDAGETIASNEVSQATTGTTSTVTYNWTAVTGATGYNLRRGTATGTEKFLVRLGAVTSYTDTGAVTPGTGVAPTSGPVKGSLTVTDFNGYLVPYQDNAEHLTTRLQGARNYDPYTDGDFGTSTLTDVPLVVRAKLKQQYQWVAVAGVQLSPKYAYAANAAPLSTLFDVIADGQKEIARVNTLYASPRNFYVGEVFTEIGRTLEIGDVWNITYPIGSLTNGQQLLVVGIEEQPSESLSRVVFWGL